MAIRPDGEKVLIDLKTSNGCWPEYSLQVAAYSRAFEETYRVKVDRAIILRLGKTAPVEFDVIEVADISKSFRAFITAKELQEILSNEQYL